MLQPLFLRDTENERAAALLLRHSRPVLIRVAKDQARYFADEGFLKCFDAIECFVDVNVYWSYISRRMRSQLSDAMHEVGENSKHFRLVHFIDLAPDVILRDIYYGVVVPHLYAKGLAPHGVQNETTFLSFLKTGDLFVLSEYMGTIVSVGVLRPKGESGKILEGLLWASRDSSRASFLWFLQECIRHAAAAGFLHLSLGKDLPWAQARYASTILQKMRLCTFVALHRNRHTTLFADFRSTPEEPHILFCESEPFGNIAGKLIPDSIVRGLERLVDRKAVIHDIS